MKITLIISVLIISAKCGLLDDLVTDEQKASLNNLLGKTPKPDAEKTEYHQGMLVKVKETLENGTKIIIDALRNVIKINPKESKEIPKTGNTELTTKKPITGAETGKDEANKTIDNNPDKPTTNATTEEAQKDLNETASKTEDQPKNNTLSTKDDGKVTDNAKNKTGANNAADGDDKLCTDDKPCDKVVTVTRTSFKGDECPAGKDRADDGTCVEEV
ncbi:unnamed protein product [Spodoptera exigua]|nr:unnamed protein product [Spodoptera exigua]